MELEYELDVYWKRNLFFIIVLFMALAMTINPVSAATTIPRIEPYVNDFAGVLSPAEELKLNQLSDLIENQTSFEIAIVIVKDTGGQDRLEFAGKIGDQNGVGKKDKDNGIVVLWSLGDDKGGAIATGRGSESFITDATTGTIGRASRPYFDKGEYYNGMNYIVVELDKAIVIHQNTPVQNATASGGALGTTMPAWFWWAFGGLLVVLFIKLISDLFGREYDETDYYSEDKKSRKRNSIATAATTLAVLSNSSDDDDDDDSSSGSGSSGSGGSFGSFGGGSFGGGGGKF